jgi:hypothetical protein
MSNHTLTYERVIGYSSNTILCGIGQIYGIKNDAFLNLDISGCRGINPLKKERKNAFAFLNRSR